MPPAKTRALLRSILRLLIAERADAQLLYIPHGESGQRRLIAQLLAMRTPGPRDGELQALLAQLASLDAAP